MTLCRFLLLVVLLTLAPTSTTATDDDYSHLLDCLTHGSDSKEDCAAMDDCVWCPASTKSCCAKEGLCVSNKASESFDSQSHYQCTASTDDDDDYFPSSDDDSTFDDDKAVDDDAAPTADDDAAPTTDDDANNNDDDYNPYTDDDQATDDKTPDDDAANNDDDNTDDYMKKLLECLAVANQTACASNSPTECVWCTTSFGEGLCMSDEAGHDIDGYFYTCQWNTTNVLEEAPSKYFNEIRHTTLQKKEEKVDSSVYDHYCWNAHDEEACEAEVDGRDVPCVWCPNHGEYGTCFSQSQVDFVESCQVEREE